MQSMKPPQRRGVVLVLFAVTLVVFLVAMAFSVDTACMQLTRMELRNAVDAATRAGVESLSRQQDEALALMRAKEVAALNNVAGQSFSLPAADVTFGRVDISSFGISSFSPGASPPNALRITSGRLDGNVGLFLGGILGGNAFKPTQTATAAQLDRDLVLVLDRSLSMQGGKFDDLKDAVSVYLDELDNTSQVEHVAITIYDAEATKILALTSDTSAARSVMASQVTGGGGTAIGLGLAMGVDSILNDANRRPLAAATIVLMTDGQHNAGIDPEYVADSSPDYIKLHTITFGSGADQTRMADLAAMRNGMHYHAANGDALIDVFREVASTLPVIMTD